MLSWAEFLLFHAVQACQKNVCIVIKSKQGITSTLTRHSHLYKPANLLQTVGTVQLSGAGIALHMHFYSIIFNTAVLLSCVHLEKHRRSQIWDKVSMSAVLYCNSWSCLIKPATHSDLFPPTLKVHDTYC